MGRRLLIGLAIGVLALAGATTASAADSVYWSNYEHGNLSHAALTGGGAEITPSPLAAGLPFGSGINAAAGKIYWGDSEAEKIDVANLDGSGSSVLPTGAASISEPNGTVVDSADGRVYWANAFDNTISWANLDGSGGGNVATGAAPIHTPYGIAVDPSTGRIYWANFEGASIGYANLDGSGGGEVSIPAGLVLEPDGVALDPRSGRIYWSNFEGEFVGGKAVKAAGTIGWADLSGVGAGLLPIPQEFLVGPSGLAIDPAAARIYWADEFGGSIASASLDGSSAAYLDVSGATSTDPSYPSLLKAPESSAAPTLSGGTAVGSTLTCKPGTWAGDLVESQLYRTPQTMAIAWTLNGAPLNGATAATLTATQPGAYACQSIATDGAGQTVSTSGSITVAAPVPLPPTVSVRLTRVKFDKNHGTATILVNVSGPGTLSLSGKKVVPRSVKASGAGIAKLKVASKGGALKTLIRSGKVRVRLTVKFLATEGARASATRAITLHRSHHPRGVA